MIFFALEIKNEKDILSGAGWKGRKEVIPNC